MIESNPHRPARPKETITWCKDLVSESNVW